MVVLLPLLLVAAEAAASPERLTLSREQRRLVRLPEKARVLAARPTSGRGLSLVHRFRLLSHKSHPESGNFAITPFAAGKVTPINLFGVAGEARSQRKPPTPLAATTKPSGRARQIAHVFGLLQVDRYVAEQTWRTLDSASMVELFLSEPQASVTVLHGRLPVMSVAHRIPMVDSWRAKISQMRIRRKLPNLPGHKLDWGDVFDVLVNPPDLESGSRRAFSSVLDAHVETWLGDMQEGGVVPFVAASEHAIRVGLFGTTPLVLDGLQFSIEEISYPEAPAGPPGAPVPLP